MNFEEWLKENKIEAEKEITPWSCKIMYDWLEKAYKAGYQEACLQFLADDAQRYEMGYDK